MISLEVKSFSLFADKEKKHLLFKTNKTVFSVGVLQMITGPSGSGKTSFLNALAGANKQFDGQLSFVEDGHRNLPWENSFSYVTVDNCYLPELSVEDHLSLVTGDKEKIREYLQMLGLWEIRKRKLSLCSKGERVRTEIATSLCRSSSLILLDEPTANLDNENKCLVFQALMTIAKTRIVIVVTHDCDPEILNKSNVFRIENQTLVKLPSSPIHPLNEIVSPSKNAEKEKGSHSFLPIIKLSAAAALKHKMQFFFSVFFLIVSLMGSFLFVGFKGINEEESLLTATPKMPSQENEVVCKDTSLALPQVGKEGFHFTKMVMSSPLDGQYLNLACAEDLTPDLSANVLSLLNNANVSQANDSASPCYPIVITSEFDNYLSAKEGHSFGIQDSLPVSLSQCVYAIPHERRKSQFIIAGIIDKISDIQDFSPDRGFPAILRKKDYLCCLEDSGIRDSSFTDSLQALLTQYQTYCEQEKLTCPKTLQIPLQLTSLLRVSDFSSDAICSTNPATKEDGKLYYQGSLPMAENEILIPEDQSISSYAALKFIYSTGREQESDHSFFDPYQKEKQYHLPLAENAFSNFGLSLGDSFIVSGSFVLNSSTRNLKDCVLISDSLFDKIVGQIRLGYTDLVPKSDCFAGTDYLTRNVSDYLNGNLQVESLTWKACVEAYQNTLHTAYFFQIIFLIAALICLFVSLLYVLNTTQDLQHDIAVLQQLMGKKRKEIVALLLASLAPFLFLSYGISLSFSQLSFNQISKAISFGSGYSGTLMTNTLWLAYLIQGAVLIGFTLFSFFFSIVGKKKKPVQQIKEGNGSY